MNYPKVEVDIQVTMFNPDTEEKIVFKGSVEEFNEYIYSMWRRLPFTEDQIRIDHSNLRIIYI